MTYDLELTEQEMDFVWDALNFYTATEYAYEDGHKEDFISKAMKSIHAQITMNEQVNQKGIHNGYRFYRQCTSTTILR